MKVIANINGFCYLLANSQEYSMLYSIRDTDIVETN